MNEPMPINKTDLQKAFAITPIFFTRLEVKSIERKLSLVSLALQSLTDHVRHEDDLSVMEMDSVFDHVERAQLQCAALRENLGAIEERSHRVKRAEGESPSRPRR